MQSNEMLLIPLLPPPSRELELYLREEKEVWVIFQAMAMQCPVCPHYPIFHILKFLGRKFLLTQIEALFFAYMARQTGWRFDDPVITRSSGSVKDFITFKQDRADYKNLVMYLAMIAYSIKECLGGESEEYLPQALKLCPQFLEAFGEWSDRHAGAIRGISPKTINYLYKSISLGQKVEDYNATVDEIIRISEGYDIKRGEEEKKKEYKALKDEAKNGMYWRQKPEKKAKVEVLDSTEFCATFSDSGIYKLREAGSTGEEEDLILGNRRIDELGIELCGSMRGMLADPDFVHNMDDDYCEQINMGANEGVSEQVFILRENTDLFPPLNLQSEKQDFLHFWKDEGDNDGLL